MDFTDIFHEVV